MSTIQSVKQTWSRVKRKVIKPAVARLDVELDNLRSGDYIRYREWLTDYVGLLPLNGFVQRPFPQLFVDPLLAYQPGAMPTARKLPRWLRQGVHPIADFFHFQQSHKHRWLIVAEPGQGKTTLMRHIAYQIAQSGMEDPLTRLPFLLVVRTLAEAVAQRPAISLVEGVYQQLTAAGFAVAPAWLADQMANGRCLFLLDGLDEIPAPNIAQTFTIWLAQQVALIAGNQFVVSTRPYAYTDEPLADWTRLLLLPFNQAQVETFVQHWWRAFPEYPGNPARSATSMLDGLEQELAQRPLSQLASHPLHLTMLANLYQPGSSLPQSRPQLFADFVVEMLIRRQGDADPIKRQLEAHLRQHLLGYMAYNMTSSGHTYLAAEQLIQALGDEADWVNESGLMLQTAVGPYRFTHPLLQAYLTAVYIRAHQLGDTLKTNAQSLWWHDIIHFYAAHADVTPLIATGLTGRKPAPHLLHLTQQCLAELPQIPPKLLEVLPHLLWSWTEDPNPDQQRLVAELLLDLRLRQLTCVAPGLLADTSLVSHAEYQLFLDEMQGQGDYVQPDHWLAYQFSKGQAAEPAVGLRSADAEAFCQWLSQRQDDSCGYHFRLPYAGELNGRLALPASVDKSSQGLGYWVRSGDFLKIEYLSSTPAHVDIILQRQLTRDLQRAFSYANQVGFHFGLNSFLPLDPTRAFAFDLAQITLPLLDYEVGRALSLSAKSISLEQPDQLFTQVINPIEMREKLDVLLLNLASALAMILNIEHETAQEFIFNIHQTCQLAQQRSLESRPILARQFVRFYAAILAATLYELHQKQKLVLAQSSDSYVFGEASGWERALKEQIRTYLDVYTDMVVLDERRASNLTAVEALRLVREQK